MQQRRLREKSLEERLQAQAKLEKTLLEKVKSWSLEYLTLRQGRTAESDTVALRMLAALLGYTKDTSNVAIDNKVSPPVDSLDLQPKLAAEMTPCKKRKFKNLVPGVYSIKLDD